METVRNFLNKIRWDNTYDEDEYSVSYFDRVRKFEIQLPFANILDINQTHLTTYQCVVCVNNRVIKIEEETCIPFHRIKKIYKCNKIVYSR